MVHMLDIWLKPLALVNLNGNDVELGAHDANNLHGLAVTDRRAALIACRRAVARAALHVSYFANSVGRYGSDHSRTHADQRRNAGFAGTLGMMEYETEDRHHRGGDEPSSQGRKRRADPDAPGRFDMRENQPES